jgi:hypothetical protein
VGGALGGDRVGGQELALDVVMSVESVHQFMLDDVAEHLGVASGALWRGVKIPGRFLIDTYEQPLGGIEPGLGVTQIYFRCNRERVPRPWPELGDHLTIREQVYEIVERGEDDLGEFDFRLIKEERGIRTVTSEGAVRANGRPSRRAEIVQAFEAAVASGLDPARPLKELCAIMHHRLGNGGGFSDRTLRRVVGELVRERRR